MESSGTGTISANRIYDLTNTSTATTTLPGIAGYRSYGGAYTIANNQISITNSNNTNAMRIFGLYEGSGNSTNFFYNTVYIGGSLSSGAARSSAFEDYYSSTSILNNNFLYNERTGGTGKHYAIYISAGTYSSSSNKNLFVVPTAAASNLGYISSADKTFTTWKSSGSYDANSYSYSSSVAPSTIFTSTSTGDLSIPSGVNRALVARRGGVVATTTDYTSSTRDGTFPSIGSIEYTGVTGDWTGATSTAFATTTNWSTGALPTGSDNVAIPAWAPNMPLIASGTGLANNVSINSGASLTVNGTGIMQIAGSITNAGTFTSTAGTIEMNGSSAQTIPASSFVTNTIQNLIVSNTDATNGVTLGGALNITGTLSFTGSNRKLQSAGFLTLVSNSTGTARIADITNAGANSGNSITGNVNVQRYIAGGNSNGTPGRRGFRFLSHPFTADLALTPLMVAGNIDITGPAGQGFTTNPNSGATNNPSAFWYNPTAPGAGNTQTVGSGAANDNGWTGFTYGNGTLDGTNHNLWKSGNGIRVLFRGAKGEGLAFNGTNYTLTDVTLSLTGTVNTGNKTFTLPASGDNQWSLVGNPYPSPIEVRTLLFTKYNGGVGLIGATAYVFNPNKVGTPRGGYDDILISSAGSYILPAYGVVLVENKTASANVINFAETDKSGSAASLGFRTLMQGTTIGIDLVDAVSNEVMDDYNLRFDNKALASTMGDTRDGGKLLNNYSIYSISESDNRMLKVDSRPIPSSEESRVRLGIYSSSVKSMILNVTDLNLPIGMDVYLKDNFLNKKELITGTTYGYNFEVTSDANSQGTNRFELVMQKAPAPPITKLSVTVGPNPSTDFVLVKMQAPKAELTTLRIIGVDGKTVEMMNLGSVSQINQQIAVKRLVAGTYVLQVIHGSEVITEKIIKQ